MVVEKVGEEGGVKASRTRSGRSFSGLSSVARMSHSFYSLP